MPQNRTKARLAEGKTVFGTPLTMDAPALVEMLGNAGLDFVMIDCEAGPMGFQAVEGMVRAAEVAGITPLVRVPSHAPEEMGRFLDRGAQGVIVPHVSSREGAEAVVTAVKYPPSGRRGFAPARWRLAYRGEEDIFAAANRETLVACMVEEREGVENLGEIASVEGVDVVLIGPNDLAASLGYTGQTWHPEVQRIVEEAADLIRSLGRPWPVLGVGAVPVSATDRYRAFQERGVRYFNVGLDGIIGGTVREFLGRVQG